MPDSSWRDLAACRDLDPDIFFPPKGAGPHVASTARRICASCPVSTQCLDFAIDNDVRCGIWAGMNYHQLRLERRRRSMFRVNYRADQRLSRHLGLP